MSDRAILFSAPMIRAMRAGQKTHTRRLAPPRWTPGDLLWVREAVRFHVNFNRRRPLDIGPGTFMLYEADGALPPQAGRLRPSIHMPRWASRMTLEVMAVREERLQTISHADAIAEGVVQLSRPSPDGRHHFGVRGLEIDEPSPVKAYLALWEHINGRPPNPLRVWVTVFNVHMEHIDAVKARRGLA